LGAERGEIRHNILDPVRRQPKTMRAGCLGWPPDWRGLGVLTTGLGAPGGSADGGEEELEELRLSWQRSSWSWACKRAICC